MRFVTGLMGEYCQLCILGPVLSEQHLLRNDDFLHCASVWPPTRFKPLKSQLVGDAMIERIVSKLSDNSYEATLAVCAVCSVASLILAAIS